MISYQWVFQEVISSLTNIDSIRIALKIYFGNWLKTLESIEYQLLMLKFVSNDIQKLSDEKMKTSNLPAFDIISFVIVVWGKISTKRQ